MSRGATTATEKVADRFVLDTYAVLAFLEGEPGAERVADVLRVGDPWMTLINLGEVAYVIERAQGKSVADVVYANLLVGDRPRAVSIQRRQLAD